MNFENFPAQMTALFIGWSFTVYLQYRSNRRAESLKRKDKIVDKLEALSGWVESEIKKKNFSYVNTETTYAGMISQIEGKILQLNSHVGRDVFDRYGLLALREIEIYPTAIANAQTPYKVTEAVADVVEHIEACCDAEYFSKRGFWAKLKCIEYYQILKCISLALICVLLFLAIFQFFHRYVGRPLGTCVYGEQCHLAPGHPAPKTPPTYFEKYRYYPSDKTP